VSLAWFRLYGETVDDAKLKLLAFEDRWHYVAVLCCKCQGLQDTTTPDRLDRIIGVKLGLAARELEEVKRRLMAETLIDKRWQPVNWDRRQFTSDSSAERTRKWRETHKKDSDKTKTDTDTEYDVTGDVAVTSQRKPKRATGLPEDFALDEDLTKFATDRLPRVDCPELLVRFKAYHDSKATTSMDWRASWRTYVGNATRFGYPMLTVGPVATPAKITRIDPNGRVING
jgi:hypothetical protein